MRRTPQEILVRPVVTEESSRLQFEENKYTFEVISDASKPQIREAVEEFFEVEVTDVGIADGGRIRRLYPQNPSLKPDRTEMSSRGGERTSVSTRTDDDVHPNGQKRPVHKESTERSLQKGEKHKGDSPKKKDRVSPCEECGDPTILDTCDSCASTARTV